jgi:hypothetical protein
MRPVIQAMTTNMSDRFSNSQQFRKAAIVSKGGIVAAQARRAAEIGTEVLAAGGDCVDAVVATGFALGVLEPWMNGVGGGGAMVLYRARGSIRGDRLRHARAMPGATPWRRRGEAEPEIERAPGRLRAVQPFFACLLVCLLARPSTIASVASIAVTAISTMIVSRVIVCSHA